MTKTVPQLLFHASLVYEFYIHAPRQFTPLHNSHSFIFCLTPFGCALLGYPVYLMGISHFTYAFLLNLLFFFFRKAARAQNQSFVFLLNLTFLQHPCLSVLYCAILGQQRFNSLLAHSEKL
jgi:hypothetical protein